MSAASGGGARPPRLLLLDNHDSFTWNLAHGFEVLGARVEVVTADGTTPERVLAAGWDGIVISPGPGGPDEAGISVALCRAAAGRVPLLGVCLGHQAIARAFGATVARAGRLMHGKTSTIRHDGHGVFRGLPQPFEATRYHSLAVVEASLPHVLEATAFADDGTLMGLRHRRLPLEGVQFHPESILTAAGSALLHNFVAALGAQASARRPLAAPSPLMVRDHRRHEGHA
jgi:anthranilate synthase/aminodeoxychorismate synthase-like glutamine amidotransferase